MRRRTFCLKLILVVITLITVILILYESIQISSIGLYYFTKQQLNPESEEKTLEKLKEKVELNLEFKSPKSTSNKFQEKSKFKTILLWSKRYRSYKWNMRQMDTMCAQDRCKFVIRRKAYKRNITEYDAIFFHAPDFPSFAPWPKQRSPKQLYVFVSQGAPQPSHLRFIEGYQSFFNFTLTHRLDSDLPWPYAAIKDKETNKIVAPSISVKWRSVDENFHDEKLLKFTEGKTRDAIAVISHCDANSKRDEVITKLKEFIDVDVYGKCGDFDCNLKNVSCLRHLDQKYRFYASFENTICKDYVTEKVNKILARNMIPLIYGGGNYKFFLPPKSYISVNDFKSMKELGDYLKFLSNNPKEYIKYFWWKKYYTVAKSGQRYCAFCQFLHKNNQTKVYKDFKSWWMSEKICDFDPVVKN